MKNNKGITMISLVITIIVLIIVTSITIYNGTAQLGIKRVNSLYADIDSISTKVAEYYLKNGKLPVFENKYIDGKDSKANLEKIFKENGATTDITNVNDEGAYYVIDLNKLDNLTLNYGDDYKEWTNTSTSDDFQNIYIINSVTHEIYFPHGVRSGKDYYFARFPDENKVSSVELEDIEDNWSMNITNILQNNIDENNISLVADITLNNLEGNYDLNSLEYAWTETNDESDLENISFTKFNVTEEDKTATIASKSLSNTAKKYYLCVKIADINGKTSYKYTDEISVPYVSLPNEYQKVEYIESTGTQGKQYIDTGISPTRFITVSLDMEFTEHSSSSMVIVAWSTGAGHWFGQNSNVYSAGNGAVSSVDALNRKLIDVTFNENSLSYTIDNNTFSKASSASSSISYTLFAGRNTKTGMSYYSKAKIYEVTIKENDKIIMHLIPCYRKSDNVNGLYDVVGGEFFTDPDGKAFNVGNKIN